MVQNPPAFLYKFLKVIILAESKKNHKFFPILGISNILNKIIKNAHILALTLCVPRDDVSSI